MSAAVEWFQAADQTDRISPTTITRYVCKEGRKACTSETTMQEYGTSIRATDSMEGLQAGVSNGPSAHWTSEQVQEECNKHLEVARNFAALDQLHETFIGHS